MLLFWIVVKAQKAVSQAHAEGLPAPVWTWMFTWSLFGCPKDCKRFHKTEGAYFTDSS